MIVKDADPKPSGSQRVLAGARAERDMAFYLRRAFGDHRADVLVFHDIRLRHEDEVAQIDHLVIHAHGMVVIESKSVSGEIQITADGQFVRCFGRGKRVGMPSPVKQAQRQADLLRRLLQSNKTDLRDRKLLGMIQGGFAHCPIEVRVAISDNGIIRGEEHAPEVRKADQITDDIEARIKAHQKGGRLLNLDTQSEDGLYRFTKGELERLQQFLLDRHVPRSAAEETTEARGASAGHAPPPAARSPGKASTGAAAPSPVAPVVPERRSAEPNIPAARYLCSKCHSLHLQVRHGRYGYYFKCRDCDGNTWIDTRIEETKRKGRIRKSGRDFFLVCPDTGKERLVFTNPDDGE